MDRRRKTTEISFTMSRTVGGFEMEEGDGRANDPSTRRWRRDEEWEAVVSGAMRLFDEEEKVSIPDFGRYHSFFLPVTL